LLQAFAKAIMSPKTKSAAQPEPMSYYKSNMNTIVGDGETVPWPAYTSRLDVEPELAVVYGNEKQPVAGFGTIPDCTGLDHDDFIDPGAEIQITFERLGTLRCRFAEPAGKLLPSRWPMRGPLQKYHE
jgi:2-keto-4-pentenoate hydratase/2-oxohepta-3-ene-1,7-dioic acid hydratase in catechol pathway